MKRVEQHRGHVHGSVPDSVAKIQGKIQDT